MSSQDKSGSFFYMLLGYLLILVFLLAIALIIGVILYRFEIVPGRIPSEDAFAKWGGLTFFSLVIFWWVIKESRPRWRNRVFWWTIVAVLFVHIAGFSMAFRYVEHWRAFYFFVITMIEVPIIMTVANWTFERFATKHHSKGGVAHP